MAQNSKIEQAITFFYLFIYLFSYKTIYTYIYIYISAADSPLEDISDVKGLRVFLDILAGFNFHLSLCIKFHLDYSD